MSENDIGPEKVVNQGNEKISLRQWSGKPPMVWIGAIFFLLVAASCGGGGTSGPSGPPSYDSLGDITTLAQFPCPAGGMANSTCFEATITNCTGYDAPPNGFVAQIKVNAPPSPVGAVFFTTGGWSNVYYDYSSAFMTEDPAQAEDPQDPLITCPVQSQNPTVWNCGLQAVQTVYNAGYVTIQTNFTDPSGGNDTRFGISTGPSNYGARQTSCRYTTLVNAFYSQIMGGATGFPHPVCATGNSHGSGIIGYAITQYGMGRGPGNPPTSNPNLLEFTMVQPTGGPTASRGDLACNPNPNPVAVSCDNNISPPISVSPGLNLQEAEYYIDPSADGDCDFTGPNCTGTPVPHGPQDICGWTLEGNYNPPPNKQFIHGSILSDDFPNPSYSIPVNIMWGQLDTSYAVAEGQLFLSATSSSQGIYCSIVPNAPHEIPQTYVGAMAIANGLIPPTGKCQ